MLHVLFTQQALSSLQEVMLFVSTHQGEDKALALGNMLIERAEELAKYPYRGQKELLLADLNLGHRRLVVGRYKIIYKVEETCIYITDVFDTRQDPRHMLP